MLPRSLSYVVKVFLFWDTDIAQEYQDSIDAAELEAAGLVDEVPTKAAATRGVFLPVLICKCTVYILIKLKKYGRVAGTNNCSE